MHREKQQLMTAAKDLPPGSLPVWGKEDMIRSAGCQEFLPFLLQSDEAIKRYGISHTLDSIAFATPSRQTEVISNVILTLNTFASLSVNSVEGKNIGVGLGRAIISQTDLPEPTGS